jgi:hypothetical protein
VCRLLSNRRGFLFLGSGEKKLAVYKPLRRNFILVPADSNEPVLRHVASALPAAPGCAAEAVVAGFGGRNREGEGPLSPGSAARSSGAGWCTGIVWPTIDEHLRLFGTLQLGTIQSSEPGLGERNLLVCRRSIGLIAVRAGPILSGPSAGWPTLWPRKRSIAIQGGGKCRSSRTGFVRRRR